MLYWKNSNLSSFHVFLNFLNHSLSFMLQYYTISLLYSYITSHHYQNLSLLYSSIKTKIEKWGPNLSLLLIWRSYSHAAQSWSFSLSSLQDQTSLLPPQGPFPKPISLKKKKKIRPIVHQQNNAQRCQYLYPTHWFITSPVTSLHNRHSTKSLSRREFWTRSLHVTSSSLV